MLPIIVHPAFVHFPLAMAAAAWVSLLLFHRGLGDEWDARVRLFEVIAVAFLPITIIAGFVDDGGPAALLQPEFDEALTWHAITAIAASAIIAGHWWWRRSRDVAQVRAARLLDLGTMTAGFWLFVMAGTIAGEMVHG